MFPRSTVGHIVDYFNSFLQFVSGYKRLYYDRLDNPEGFSSGDYEAQL